MTEESAMRHWLRPLFGPMRRTTRTGVPADHFPPARLMFGDADGVLIAEGPTAVDDAPAVAPETPQEAPETPAAEIEGESPPSDPPAPEADAPLGHDPMTGSHTHEHTHGDGTTHSHTHFHNDAAVHNHQHAASALSRLTETERRRIDGANEITDSEALDALVASAFARAGGIDALNAKRASNGLTAALAPDGTVTPGEWHAYLCAEGIRTDDGRELLPMSCRFPDLPVSIRLLVEDEGGHWGAVTCGRIDSMDRRAVDSLSMIYSEGMFGSDPNGQLAELMVEEQTQRFVSIDPRDVTGEWIEVEVIVSRSGGDIYGHDDSAYDCWYRIADCVIGAATIVAMPAIQNAVITMRSVPLPSAPLAIENAPPSLGDIVIEIESDDDEDDPDGDGMGSTPIVAAGGPARPQAAWFSDPGFQSGDPRLVPQPCPKCDSVALCACGVARPLACPWTVTPEGQVYGHVAYWQAEHTGFPDGHPVTGKPVNPPRSKSGYSWYMTGPGVECADGSVVSGVGQVTMGCGHATTARNIPYREVTAHYDGGYGAVQVADVKAGEDEFGIWIAGAMRSDLTDEQVREARALAPSGDWREIGDALDMVAVLLVPVPGFPIARSLVASATGDCSDGSSVRLGTRDDVPFALVAAGRVRSVSDRERIVQLEARLAAIESTVRPMAVDALRKRIGR